MKGTIQDGTTLYSSLSSTCYTMTRHAKDPYPVTLTSRDVLRRKTPRSDPVDDPCLVGHSQTS